MKKKALIGMLAAAVMMAMPVQAEESDLEQRIADLESRVAALEADSATKQEVSDAFDALFEGMGFTVSDPDAASDQGTADSVVSGTTFSSEGFEYEYLKTEIFEQDGAQYAVVYYTFTNNSGTNVMPAYAQTAEAFQNGVKLDWYLLTGAGVQEIDNCGKEVQDGTTIDIAFAYKISDTSDISLEIGPMMRTNDTPVWKFTASLE